ncbi:hypothetical protein DENSPDRAFT_206690 [Dentipellis sp. KUC8613]|nr:hypothetical protein DENSPDRAFT_206690 [Dentipellis sp. KUC8613]
MALTNARLVGVALCFAALRSRSHASIQRNSAPHPLLEKIHRDACFQYRGNQDSTRSLRRRSVGYSGKHMAARRK